MKSLLFFLLASFSFSGYAALEEIRDGKIPLKIRIEEYSGSNQKDPLVGTSLDQMSGFSFPNIPYEAWASAVKNGSDIHIVGFQANSSGNHMRDISEATGSAGLDAALQALKDDLKKKRDGVIFYRKTSESGPDEEVHAISFSDGLELGTFLLRFGSKANHREMLLSYHDNKNRATYRPYHSKGALHGTMSKIALSTADGGKIFLKIGPPRLVAMKSSDVARSVNHANQAVTKAPKLTTSHALDGLRFKFVFGDGNSEAIDNTKANMAKSLFITWNAPSNEMGTFFEDSKKIVQQNPAVPHLSAGSVSIEFPLADSRNMRDLSAGKTFSGEIKIVVKVGSL